MQKLIFLYWGAVFLMYLSQVCFPAEVRLQEGQNGRRHFMWKTPDIFMIITIFWLSSFSFLRTNYNDTVNYIYDFLNLTDPLDVFIAEDNLLDLGGCPLFCFYQTLVREYTDNYHVFFLFPALLSSIAVIKLIKQYSVSPAFSVLIFFSIGTYVMYIAAMKQSIAVSILLFALPYALDNKNLQYYLLVILAMLFHTHAFVFLIVPFFMEKPWSKTTWILLAIVLLAMMTYNITFGAFMNIALGLGVNIVDWEVFDGHSIHPLRVVLYWIPAIMALCFRDRLFHDSSRAENLFANLSIGAAFILTIGLVQGANLFARMAAYYEVAVCITMPWMIQKLFTKQSVKISTALAVILYFGYFLYEFGVSKSFSTEYTAITFREFISRLLG